jgi:hypothetical protein
MKRGTGFNLALAIVAFVIGFGSTGCKKNPPPAQTTYTLKIKDVLGISGNITFTETSSSVTTIAIAMTGAAAGSHPASIRSNSAVEGGAIAITLNPVDSTGKSSTSVSMLDNGTVITYSQLIAFDGYADIINSSTDTGTVLAQADIGGNALTSTSQTYTLATVSSGVSGTALFAQRVNNNTLVTLTINGTLPGGSYPAFIRLGSVSTVGGGPVEATLQNVDGSTGKVIPIFANWIT